MSEASQKPIKSINKLKTVKKWKIKKQHFQQHRRQNRFVRMAPKKGGRVLIIISGISWIHNIYLTQKLTLKLWKHSKSSQSELLNPIQN